MIFFFQKPEDNRTMILQYWYLRHLGSWGERVSPLVLKKEKKKSYSKVIQLWCQCRFPNGKNGVFC